MPQLSLGTNMSQSHRNKLQFYSNSAVESRYRVSKDAKDLIKRLLTDKETRICSRKYEHNDIEVCRRRKLGKDYSSDNLRCQDFLGHFVFPDDAQEIKRHPFFRGIDWGHLHQMRPPEVPKVDSKADTRYFDEGSVVSDLPESSSSAPSIAEEQLAQEALIANILQAYKENGHTAPESRHQDRGLDGQHIEVAIHNANDEAVDDEELIAAAQDILRNQEKKERRQKEKRRPRDRILRDKAVAKEAMELRKQGAFLGYEYVRPPSLTTDSATERKQDAAGTKCRRPQFPTLASFSRFHRPQSQG